MNEKPIQQVLEIEKQAETIHADALKEAEQLPAQAEQEAQQLLEKMRADAEAEAREMIEKARSQDESARIIAQAEEKTRQIETVAKNNTNRAVAYVIEQVVGRGT